MDNPTLQVWIDQDLCTGDGLCVDACPEVFTILEDGIAYVVDDGTVGHDPGGAGSPAAVPTPHEAAVIEAATICPGECIMLEPLDEALVRLGDRPAPTPLAEAA